jgi:hypothetical protein
MLEGAERYAAYVIAERTEPQFVKMAQTFFGPGEHFKAEWQSSRRGHQSANDEAKRRLFGGNEVLDAAR